MTISNEYDDLQTECTEVDDNRKWWGRLVSIKGMVIMLCLWSVACAGGTAAAIAVTSYESAMDKTQSASEDSTRGCFTNAKSSLRAVTKDLLSLNAAAVVDSVTQMTTAARSTMELITRSYQYTDPLADKSTWDYLYQQRKPLHFATESMAPFGIAGVVITLHDPTKDNKMQRSILLANTAGVRVTQTIDGLIGENNSIATLGSTILNDGGIMVPWQTRDMRSEFGSYELVNDGMIVPGGDPIYRHLVYNTAYVGMSLVKTVVDPISGIQAAFAVTLSLESMSEVLRKLAETSMQETGALIYLYTTVASSKFYEMIKEKQLEQKYPNERFNEVGILTAVSSGNVTKIVFKEADFHYDFLEDTEANDPTIRGIANGIHAIPGNYESVQKSTDVTEVSANGTGFIVEVNRVVVTEGLDWWLVSAINVEYVVGETQRAHDAAVQNDAAIRSEVDSDLESDRRLMIIILVTVAVVLVVAATFCVYRILSPLESLKTEMKSVSEMNLETSQLLQPTVFYELSAMQASFQVMVRNLKEYKAYVPTAVLEGSSSADSIAPPSGKVAIVFTDIVSSTSLWARSPSAMNDSLELHNNCIRALIAKHRGYEVKTIGDCFMVSFPDIVKAVAFCLQSQEELVKQSWPAELELPPQYGEGTRKQQQQQHQQGDSIPQWHGLRLRMGCHYGEAGVEENPLTGRADYRGPTVNMAARLESKALPGSLCVSSETYRLMIQSRLADISNPATREMGPHELKGIGTIDLTALCPQTLSGRLSTRSTYEIAMHEFQMEDTATTHSVTSIGSTVRMSRQKKTGLSLTSGQLTVAVCRLNDTRNQKVFENYNLMLKAAIEAASQTDGVLSGVSGRALTVVWNGSRPCRLHTTCALRFASQLQLRISTIGRIGVGTGSLLHGNVGTVAQRFATAFGRPLEAAEASADMALSLDTFAVIADCTEGRLSDNSAIMPFLRLADVWLDEEHHKPISIYEVLCSALKEQLEDGWGVVSDGSSTGTDAHNKTFRDVISGRVDEISKLEMTAAMSGTDPVLSKICKILRSIDPSRGTERNYRMKVKFTYLPEGVSMRQFDDVVRIDSDAGSRLSSLSLPPKKANCLDSQSH
eukprot:TRINITY_DN1503_c1_g1_i4.p1 TRINITY_DN1503_c1_g1~~TRINITY_DN1503_c1_g1_i4.p1  ORF type:complete len:1103 (+),score=239.59 TRINITY_DN1503_c1_g1_i4:38-3346(+)